MVRGERGRVAQQPRFGGKKCEVSTWPRSHSLLTFPYAVPSPPSAGERMPRKTASEADAPGTMEVPTRPRSPQPPKKGTGPALLREVITTALQQKAQVREQCPRLPLAPRC